MERVLTFTLPLFYGRGIFQYRCARGLIYAYLEHCFFVEFHNFNSFGILPHRHPITVVVGRPVSVEKIPEPTPEQVGKVIEFKTYQ